MTLRLLPTRIPHLSRLSIRYASVIVAVKFSPRRSHDLMPPVLFLMLYSLCARMEFHDSHRTNRGVLVTDLRERAYFWLGVCLFVGLGFADRR